VRAPLLTFILALLVVGAIRVRLLDVPLERDEGEYAYAGQLILQGVPPYRLVYNMKLPGTYAAYAAILAIFGQTPRGVHLGLLLVNLATAVLLFVLGRRLFDDVTAAAAGSLFAILSLSQGVLGAFAHATHFVLLPAVAGTLLLLRAIDTRRGSTLLASGLLFGTAFVMKQHGIAFVLFALLWLAWEGLRRRERPSRIAASCGWIVLGAALPFAGTCLVLAVAGVFGNFWFWTFDYARTYVSQVPLITGARLLAEMVPAVTASTWPIWVLAGVGLAAPLWDGPARRRFRFTTTFALVSFLAICPGLYFREHYFVLLLPATALLAAVGAASLARALAGAGGAMTPERREGVARAVLLAICAAAFVQSVYRERALFFRLAPDTMSRAVYGANPFPEAMVIAKRIEQDTGPDDRIAVLGSEPEIDFYAHRRSATGYIYMYGLMEEQPYARRMQQEAIREIEAHAPRYVVFVNVPQSWLRRPESDTTILTWSQSFLTDHYAVVGIADIAPDGETVYVWDDDALEYTPRSPLVYLFKRVS